MEGNVCAYDFGGFGIRYHRAMRCVVEFFNVPSPNLFFVYLCPFQTLYEITTIDSCGMQTWIVRVKASTLSTRPPPPPNADILITWKRFEFNNLKEDFFEKTLVQNF